MDEDLCQALSRACDDCHLAGGCCFEARPPLSQKRIDMLMENGVSADAIEFVGYKRLCLRQDGSVCSSGMGSAASMISSLRPA